MLKSLRVLGGLWSVGVGQGGGNGGGEGRMEYIGGFVQDSRWIA